MPLKLETGKIDKFQLVSYRRETPDGTMFVQIYEDIKTNRLLGLDLQIGKSGSSIRAYLSVISGLINLSIENEIPIYKILEIISNQTTDRVAHIGVNRQKIKSSMEALFYILTSYQTEKIVDEYNGKHKNVGYFTNPQRTMRIV